MGKSRHPKRNPPSFYADKTYVLIPDNLRDSLAYKGLPPLARLIAIDMIAVYRRASRGGREHLENGFMYTPAHSAETISWNTFYAAIKKIVEHGIFEIPPGLQGDTVAQARRFAPSKRWETWEDATVAKKLLGKRAAREKRCQRDRQRRTSFRNEPKHSKEPVE